MKLLLTSGGISNPSIRSALEGLLGKPIEEAKALFIPTAIYGIRGGPQLCREVVRGTLGDPFCEAGWKSLGLLELTALPSIARDLWVPMLVETDALLVGGGDCQYLTYWMQASGLAALLPQVLEKTVYVGLSAGSMIMTRYGTTYGHHTLPADTPKCLGWLDFALHPHLDCPGMADNALACVETLAEKLPMVSYALDDASAIQVVDGDVSVISEGTWRRFDPGGERSRPFSARGAGAAGGE